MDWRITTPLAAVGLVILKCLLTYIKGLVNTVSEMYTHSLRCRDHPALGGFSRGRSLPHYNNHNNKQSSVYIYILESQVPLTGELEVLVLPGLSLRLFPHPGILNQLKETQLAPDFGLSIVLGTGLPLATFYISRMIKVVSTDPTSGSTGVRGLSSSSPALGGVSHCTGQIWGLGEGDELLYSWQATYIHVVQGFCSTHKSLHIISAATMLCKRSKKLGSTGGSAEQ